GPGAQQCLAPPCQMARKGVQPLIDLLRAIHRAIASLPSSPTCSIMGSPAMSLKAAAPAPNPSGRERVHAEDDGLRGLPGFGRQQAPAREIVGRCPFGGAF